MSKLTDLLEAARFEAERRMKEIEDQGEGLPRVWWELREISNDLKPKCKQSETVDVLSGEGPISASEATK